MPIPDNDYELSDANRQKIEDAVTKAMVNLVDEATFAARSIILHASQNAGQVMALAAKIEADKAREPQ